MSVNNLSKCHIFKINKGNGKFRTIYAPNSVYKTELKNLVGKLTKKVERLDKLNVIQAFVTTKNCVTNAKAHIGHKFVLSMDLQDFFDNVTQQHAKDFLTKEELDLCFVDGIARQGLPTSPAIANLAFMKADKAILKALKKKNIQAVYTRYADDLTFSFDVREHASIIIAIVKEVAGRNGFKINNKKTHLQDAKNGRFIITGVGVDDFGVYPTRKVLKKLRASIHQENYNSQQGLKEWAKCKTPKLKKIKEIDEEDDLLYLSKLWSMSLRRSDLKYIPKKETICLDNDCVISGSPIDMIGMSTFTTGWTSCMSRTGCHKKGVPFWILLKGTRIAYQKSNKTLTFGKITKNQMIARCLIHELRNGKLVYDKLYGNNTKILEEELKKFGAINIEEAKKIYSRERVIGNVIKRYKPYFDNLRSGIGKRKGTKIEVRFAYI